MGCAIRQASLHLAKHISTKNPPKIFFSHVNKKSAKKEEIGVFFSKNEVENKDNIYTTPELYEYFASVFNKVDGADYSMKNPDR